MDTLLNRRKLLVSQVSGNFIGYLISGSPTINNNIVTPSSSRGFIYTNEPFNPKNGESWIIQTKIKLKSAIAYRDYIATVNSDGSVARSIACQSDRGSGNRQYRLYLSTNGTSWNLLNTGCNHYVPAINQWYILQVVCTFENGNYSFKQGFPDLSDWSAIAAVSDHPTYGKHISFGGGFSNNAPDVDIDLSETKIWINGALWWSAI